MRIRGVPGGVAVCVDGFAVRHEMECSSAKGGRLGKLADRSSG